MNTLNRSPLPPGSGTEDAGSPPRPAVLPDIGSKGRPGEREPLTSAGNAEIRPVRPLGFVALTTVPDGGVTVLVRREAPKRILEASEQLRRDLEVLFGEEPQPRRAKPLAGSPARPRQLLLVDDDELRTLLRLTLPEDDYDLRDTSDPNYVPGLVLEATPELVLLDWNMPTRSGADVLEALKRGWPRLPVIVLTAEGRSSERELAAELGADAVLRKPFSPIELLETIGRLLAERLPNQAA